MGYFDHKEELKRKAISHDNEMKKKYHDEIIKSVDNTKIYSHNCIFKLLDTIYDYPLIEIENSDSVTSLYNHKDEGKVAVLNFASYKNPGGMFLEGSSAQEECLCHASFLYEVLVKFDSTYYEWNRHNKNKSLYLNRGLYSPDIYFQKDNDIFKADVITVAAPNFKAAKRWNYVTPKENLKALASRINFILHIAENNQVDTLILGAFGCGVFGQNPIEVATIFKEAFKKSSFVKKVIFAIPGGPNLKAFETIFNQ